MSKTKQKATSFSKGEVVDFGKITSFHWMLFLIFLAVSIFGLVQFSYPYLAERHFRDGYAFLMQGRLDLAVSELEEAIRYAPWETFYMIHLEKAFGDLAAAQPSVEKRLEYYQKEIDLTKHMIALEPKSPWFENRLGILYLTMSDTLPKEKDTYIQMSKEHIEKSAQLDKQNPLFQMSLGFFYHRLGQLDKAQKLYEWVVSADARIVEAQINLANLYQQQGRHAAALNCLETIYKTDPSWNNIRMTLGQTYFRQKNMEKARFYFEEDYQKNPTSPQAQRNLIFFYMSTGDYAKALPVCEKLVLVSGSDPAVANTYHEILRHLGRR